MIQGSEEWLNARIGKVTASKVADIMAKTRSGYSASRKNYMAELLCQRLTGKREEGFTNAAMQRGTEMEPIARSRYEVETGVMVDEVGLIEHPTISDFAASPDGLVGDDGLVEIKCPNTATHIEFLQSGKIPAKYQSQMLAQMICTGRKWCDFVSFDDRLPEHLAYKCIRFELDEDAAGVMVEEVEKFLEELENMVLGLTK